MTIATFETKKSSRVAGDCSAGEIVGYGDWCGEPMWCIVINIADEDGDGVCLAEIATGEVRTIREDTPVKVPLSAKLTVVIT